MENSINEPVIQNVTRIPELGGFVGIQGDQLVWAPENFDGTCPADEWCDLTAPDSSETVALINRALNTSYRIDQFAGR